MLITGDCITNWNGSIEPGPFNDDTEQAKRTPYVLIRELAATIAAFGHGQPLAERAAAVATPQLKNGSQRHCVNYCPNRLKIDNCVIAKMSAQGIGNI